MHNPETYPNGAPLVSVVITNYNYGRYLQQAIDSALCQPYQNVEVIVVDDGSSDNSRDIMLRNRSRITALSKENGGQASAINAGFAQSRGDAVIFLDADDVLLPETLTRVAETFRQRPGIATVQYRLQLVDAERKPLGSIVPAPHLRLPNGSLRARVMRHNNTWWPPMSGNAFSRHVLKRILPMPEAPYRVSADDYLSRTAALLAPVVSLDAVLALYRIHGSNNYSGEVNLARIRTAMQRIQVFHSHLRAFTIRQGLLGFPESAEAMPDVTFLSQRLVSTKLDPAHHPIAGDTPPALCWRGVTAALGRPDVGAKIKLMHACWFIATALLPRRVTPYLANVMFSTAARPTLRQLVGRLHPRRLLRGVHAAR